MRGPLADKIKPAKFYRNRVRGFDSVGGLNFWLPHRKEKSPLTQGLNYRLACENNIADRHILRTYLVTYYTKCKFGKVLKI